MDLGRAITILERRMVMIRSVRFMPEPTRSAVLTLASMGAQLPQAPIVSSLSNDPLDSQGSFVIARSQRKRAGGARNRLRWLGRGIHRHVSIRVHFSSVQQP